MSTETSTKLARAFLDYLKEQERYDLLPEIVKNLQEEVSRNQDISVISATPLPESEKLALKNALIKKWGDHPVTFAVDPAVISGFMVRFNDTVLDCSGRNDLKDLYKTFNQ